MAAVQAYRSSPKGTQAAALLKGQGFLLPDSPEEKVELPADVSDLSAESLMYLFSLFTAWCDYAAAQVGLAVVAEREQERALEIAEAQVWRDMPKSTVTAARHLVALDERVIKSKQSLDEAYAYRRLITDVAARFERDAAVLSRELTRRTSESGPKAAARRRWEP